MRRTRLRRRDPRRVVSSGSGAGTAPTVVFMFPGGGAQYPNMGRDLYREEPVYRAEVDRGLAVAAAQHRTRSRRR